jgi:hypothetical protein
MMKVIEVAKDSKENVTTIVLNMLGGYPNVID